MSNDHLEPLLLAYIDDELTPRDRRRVEAHLATCAACQAELATLQAMQPRLRLAFLEGLSQAQLSREADTRIRQALQMQIRRRERGTLRILPAWLLRLLHGGPALGWAQGVLALMLVLFSVSAHQVMQLGVSGPAQDILVMGSAQLAPGTEAALRVVVRESRPESAAGELRLGIPWLGAGALGASAAALIQPLAAEPAAAPLPGVRVQISLRSGSRAPQLVYTGTTDASGTAEVRFVVPQWPEGGAELVVETSGAGGRGRLVSEIDLARSYRVFLMTDKPAYRPGETIRLRALVLDAQRMRPPTDIEPQARLQLRVLGPAGDEMGGVAVSLSEYGVGVWDAPLPEAAPPGYYTVRAEIGNTRAERTVHLADYTLPPFRVALTTERSYYAPGDTLVGTLTATTFYSTPVAGGQVTLRVSSGRGVLQEIQGLTTVDGLLQFAFQASESFAEGLLALEAEVVDAAGRAAGDRLQVPVSAERIQVRAMPESGALKPGVENVVYLLTTYPDGTPAGASLEVRVAGTTYHLDTGPYGLGSLRFSPQGPETLSVVARDGLGSSARVAIPLSADRAPHVLLLHTERAVYRVGETLVATALVSADAADHAYLDVARAGQLVATLSAPVQDGKAGFALDLDPSLAGALELRAYALLPGTARIQDTRVVVIDAAQSLDVALLPDRESYLPGERAHLKIGVARTEAPPAPAAALLGIAIVDESVFALDTLPPSFARTYFLVSEEMLARRDRVSGLDLPALVEAGPVPAAQDLAARAAWAGTAVAEPGISLSARVAPGDPHAPQRRVFVDRLSLTLVVLPLLLCMVLLRHLRAAGLATHVARRMRWVALAWVIGMPVLVSWVVLGWLLPMWGALLFAALALLGLVLLGIVTLEGWLRHDTHLQVVCALLVCYLVLTAWLLILAAHGAVPEGGWAVILVAAFLLLLAGILAQGQALVLAGRCLAGWLSSALAVVLVLLVATAPTVPALKPALTGAAGDPAIYLGPLAWLTGCATSQPTMMPPTPVASEPAPTAPVQRTSPATEAPLPTLTAPAVPLAPLPLRQIRPEILYWDPAIETDGQGRLALDVLLPDQITTWRVTVLASTLSGEIGSGTTHLVVKPDQP